MAERKPEGPIEFTQKPAQGDHGDQDVHALDVEREAAEHDGWPRMVGGHGQGGAGH